MISMKSLHGQPFNACNTTDCHIIVKNLHISKLQINEKHSIYNLTHTSDTIIEPLSPHKLPLTPYHTYYKYIKNTYITLVTFMVSLMKPLSSVGTEDTPRLYGDTFPTFDDLS